MLALEDTNREPDPAIEPKQRVGLLQRFGLLGLKILLLALQMPGLWVPVSKS